MSILLVKNEVLRFLASPNAEVLCVRGKWGVGKTYSWKKYLDEASKLAGGIALERYAYVSLFGTSSLDELKYTIFERTVKKDQIVATASLETLKSTVESAEAFGRKYAWALNFLPGAKSYLSSSAPLFFLSVRNQIICIDDFERKGSKLEATDVLGLISFLKEERNCKVVLLLNDEALASEDKSKFAKYLEKVADISLRFSPTAEDSATTALTADDSVSNRARELCIALGISNIRVIKKIERDIRAIKPLIDEFDQEVFKQASSSIALFGWSQYQPDDAPALEYLQSKKSNFFGLDKDEKISPTEASWNALLNAYGYSWTDEFDLVLIDGVRNGYFDPDKVKKFAKVIHERSVAAKADGSFETAWRSYHDSFADNEAEVLDTIYASFMKNFRHISPMNLDGTVRLFKELGRKEQASEMLKHYLENREQERKLFDLDEYAFGEQISDPDVQAAFRQKSATLEDKRDVQTLLLNLKDNWDDEILAELAAVPIEQYYAAFKSHEGQYLRKILAGVLQFNRISNATDAMREVSRRAKEALRRIGSESSINARRVSKLGVNVNEGVPPLEVAGNGNQ